MSLREHEHLDPAVQALLGETLDVARATAEGRAETGDLEPFALVHAGGDLRLVLLGDVAEHLADASGTGRIASTLLQRYGADAFAIAATATASPDGSPEHPQAREVVRVIVGHADGTSGATWCELRRTADGPRLTGLWETAG
ncbi:MAG: hypothetical protein M3P50_07735 [Actinomycetota bacterium]|nr:hypothetical protein [Actinomycetota bacterium]